MNQARRFDEYWPLIVNNFRAHEEVIGWMGLGEGCVRLLCYYDDSLPPETIGDLIKLNPNSVTSLWAWIPKSCGIRLLLPDLFESDARDWIASLVEAWGLLTPKEVKPALFIDPIPFSKNKSELVAEMQRYVAGEANRL